MKIAASTKNGSHSWLMQRISAVALIPLIIWLVLSVMHIIADPINMMPIFFAYPLNAFMGILFITFSLYHGSLGMKEIIESAKNTGSLGLGMYKLADDLRVKAEKAYLESAKNPAKLMAMQILLDEIQA